MLENITILMLVSFIVYTFYAMGIETNLKEKNGNKLQWLF